ncbi:MAG: hypothetical protein HFI05_06130 [Lachnospiraceae bacterium]|nr:hypothetical protein [Lachnospiraceae bacterium]
MQKIKYIGLMFLILSLVLGYKAGKSLFEIRSADSYEDKGVHSFQPYQVLPVQVKNTTTGRNKRMNPTRTVYMVYYRVTDGGGYEWRKKAVTKSEGQRIVTEGKKVERRVLSIPSENVYITIEPDQTAESYITEQKHKYFWLLGISITYILTYFIIWIVLSVSHSKEK